MLSAEWTKTWRNAELDVRLLQAHYIQHAYPRHSHDYYVLCLIDSGQQSFWHTGRQHRNPPGGVILLNPGEVHTGQAAQAAGFSMRCIYPTAANRQVAVLGLTGYLPDLPLFRQVRVDDRWAAASLATLHTTLAHGGSLLEREAALTWTLGQLFERYGEARARPTLGSERQAVLKARRYVDEHFSEGVRLAELAGHVALSPYHLLRAFRAEFGLPPHAYLENVRIRQAERLIAAGKPLAEVSAETGFSSQSHLTHRFRKIIGVTPGQYSRASAA